MKTATIDPINVKSVGATVMRNNLSDVLDAVDDERNVMLIKRRNKADAALVNIDLLEDLLALQSREYVKSIKTARKEAECNDVVSFEDVFGDL